MIDPYSDFLDF